MKELARLLSRLMMVLAITLGPIAATHLVFGQAVSGTLLGTITDPHNAVVAGATVTITEVNTNIKRSVVTNESGNYTFDHLPLGKYLIEVEHEGFKKVLKSDVDVTVNNTTRTDLGLEPGTVSEQVTISAVETPLQTDRADTGRIVEKRLVSELPLPFQNFQYLVFTVPGSTRPTRPHSQFFNSQDSMESKVNGQSRLSNNFQIEGVDDNEKTGLLQVLIPPQYAIESVSFSTSNFDAELGRAGGAVSTVTLKSGTNSIHGSAFAFGNNDNLNAGEYFTGLKAPNHFRQFGGTIGGPIKKNKIFYFGDYQYERAVLGTINRHTVPYKEWYTGDFRNAPTKIYDPATGNSDGTGRQQISCNGVLNVICANRISPIATKLLGFLPGPNISGAAFAQTNFVFSEVRTKKTNAFDTKVNFQLNSKNSLSYRFSYQQPKVFDPGTYGIYGGPTNGGFAGSGTQNTISTAANYTRTFSSSLIFEGRFGVSWYHNVAISQAAGLKTSADVGIKNVNTDSFSDGLTQININGFSGPVLGFSNSLPWDRGETTYVASGIVTKTYGNHTFKFGEEFQKNRDFLLQIQDNGGVRGHFDFNGNRTATPSDSAAQNGLANAFASFLLDLPNSVGRDIKVIDTPGTKHNSFFTFFQDRWQVSKNLTLTLGLRHEYYSTLIGIVSKGGLSNYDPATNTALVANYGAISNSANVTSTWKNFAPRAGFAYRLDDKTVVRAGFGETIIPFPDNSYAFNFPVKQNNAFNAPNSFLPTTTCGTTACPVVNMGTGFPDKVVFTVPPDGIIDGSNPVLKSSSVFAVPFNLREGRLLSWNIAFQRDLWWGFTGEAAYVGNTGHGIVDRLDLNAATALGAGLPGNDNA
ncbi:MAG TPA: TonB-dependent receptor, partial [Pyrinomonadaceae bacterium]|nr:TonB-dependent receptor [Pyrinomonadaceae bacterium]